MSVSLKDSSSSITPVTKKSKRKWYIMPLAFVMALVAVLTGTSAQASTSHGSPAKSDTQTVVVSSQSDGLTGYISLAPKSKVANPAPQGVMTPNTSYTVIRTGYLSGSSTVKATVNFTCTNGRVSGIQAWYTTVSGNIRFSTWGVNWGTCSSTSTWADFYYKQYNWWGTDNLAPLRVRY